MINDKNNIVDSKLSKASFLVLALFVALIFTNNHSALFISDYYYALVVFVACGIGIVLISGKIKIDYFNILNFILFIILIFNSIFRANDVDHGTLMSYIAWFATLIIVPNMIPTERSINLLLKSFIIGSLVCAIMIFVFKVTYGETHRYTIKFINNEIVDPNYLGCFLWIGLTFCLYFIAQTIGRYKSMKLAILYSFLAVVILYAIVLTGSRAAYLCSFLSAIGFFGQIWKRKNERYFLLFAGIIVLIVSVVCYIEIIPEEIKFRFGFSSLKDDSNAQRLEHWYWGLRAFLLHPFGYGAAHTKYVLTEYVGHRSDAHNTYITLLLQFGVVGFFIFLYLFIRLIKPFLKSKSPFWILFITAFIFNGFIIANHLGIPFWVTIVVLYYVGNSKVFESYVKFNKR